MLGQMTCCERQSVDEGLVRELRTMPIPYAADMPVEWWADPVWRAFFRQQLNTERTAESYDSQHSDDAACSVEFERLAGACTGGGAVIPLD
eukprot:IDg1962t1